MNCLDFRRGYLSDPYRLDEEQARHLRECEACTRFARRQTVWERRLETAMRVPAPENLASGVIFARGLRGRRWGWKLLAAAAMLVMAATATLVIAPWNGGMRTPEFVAHMHKDPLEMKPAMADADAVLAQVSSQLGIRPIAGLNAKIIRVKLCDVDGHMGAHLVIEHDGMRATAFVMPGARTHAAGWARIDGMEAKLVQTDQGLIAVFCPDHRGMAAALAQRLSDALNWHTA